MQLPARYRESFEQLTIKNQTLSSIRSYYRKAPHVRIMQSLEAKCSIAVCCSRSLVNQTTRKDFKNKKQTRHIGSQYTPTPTFDYSRTVCFTVIQCKMCMNVSTAVL